MDGFHEIQSLCSFPMLHWTCTRGREQRLKFLFENGFLYRDKSVDKLYIFQFKMNPEHLKDKKDS